MPETRARPRETAALLGCCDALRRSEQRLRRITEAGQARAEALLAALQRLPASARFEPFPVEATAADAAQRPVADATRPQRGRRPNAASPGRPQASPLPARAQARRGAAASPLQTMHLPGSASPAQQFVEQIGSGARFGGQLLAELMQRHAPQLPLRAQAARQVGGPGAPPGSVIGAALPPLGSQAQGASPRSREAQRTAPALRRSRTTDDARDAAAGDGQIGRLMSEWLAAPPAPAASPTPGTGDLLAQTVAQLLGHAQPARRRTTAPAQPAAAPRASSRLLQAAADAAPAQPTRRAGTPQADPLPDDSEPEALMQGLNRLLLDQAWMRGVDLG